MRREGLVFFQDDLPAPAFVWSPTHTLQNGRISVGLALARGGADPPWYLQDRLLHALLPTHRRERSSLRSLLHTVSQNTGDASRGSQSPPSPALQKTEGPQDKGRL